MYPLDYWLCVLAFIFYLSFNETLKIVKEKDYINLLIDRFEYVNEDTKNKMEEIKLILNNYIKEREREK